MADLQQHNEEQTTVNDLIENMNTYLGDCDSLPHGFKYMKKMIKDHYGDEIIIAEINGKSNRLVARGGSVGADEPPSEIKGPLFYKKVHYFEEKHLILYNLKKRSTIYCSVKVLITR